MTTEPAVAAAWRDERRLRMQRWREVARAELDAAADGLAPDGRLDLSPWSVARLLTGEPMDEPFTWSAAKVRKTVAIPALDDLAGAPGSAPLDAVRRTIERLASERTGPGPWLRSLSAAGRCAVERDATVWVTAARLQLPWPPRVSLARVNYSWPSGSAPYVVKGGSDLRAVSPGPAVLGVLTNREPGPEVDAELAHIALAATVGGPVPGQVVARHLASNQRSARDVDDGLLRDALDRCVAALRAAVARQSAHN